MGEVNYSLNGKVFRDFGVRVAKSDGLLGKLKPREQNTYKWPGYHGRQSDPMQKPEYEERNISLDCWIVGGEWQDMKEKFDELLSEFDKAGTQRLIVSPFGYKPLIYDVKLSDGVELQKDFRDGQMVGVFTLKMVEENPIKKILRIESSEFHLSFKSGKWVDINTGYTSLFKKGDVNINETLPFETSDEGNLILASTEIKKYYETSAVVDNNAKQYTYGADASGTGNYTLYAIARNKNTNVFEALGRQSYNLSGPQRIGVRFSANLDLYGKLVFTLQNTVNQTLPMSKAVLKTGYESFDYESNINTHYISLAGDVDEITELTTNAEVLWNKL
ncbi:hypothetical protein BBD31_01410 [Elizabethkingia anophelis]|uniref:hypothetical protein n=1 Tax=Elizabethkingia anophelis TaxID=1117645 RepID=UPI000994AE67|nr:hypothetical protein [Elizabethkingia anophelis]AQW96633.1 hypothetical protein BBD31_01410 [Elizabethkingia anophelis]MDV3673627.1 hypothetical protein [Elizabethkingia anophelis]MDV3692351.1 hypothetical protein [Elizabethkingia anophelis]OPB50118.1 hypothetical protein BAY04_07095 [Elizabethkingia anophelis]SPW16703.1 Uncharacterised protein [Elizabethkingia anophelis]